MTRWNFNGILKPYSISENVRMKRLGKFILAEFITSQAIIHTHLIILPNLLENVGIEKVKNVFPTIVFHIKISSN